MNRYRWAQPGDVNAFFGLMLDNLANIVLTVGLLATVFGFPATFAMRYMVPGTALGVLFGDLVYTALAFRLAAKTRRNDITAMPLGLDTPSTFGMVFFVLGPAFLEAQQEGFSPEQAARQAWHIGIGCLVISGLFKLLCALGSGWIRRVLPRAGLLGSLAAIALVLISFLPLLDVMAIPLVGLVSLGIILTTLVAHLETPGRVPGALAALLVGGGIYFALVGTGLVHHEALATDPAAGLWPYEWTEALRGEWLAALPLTVKYLPIVIPFALATVVGGIDCTESAAAAGDEYHTGTIIAVEGLATLVAGCTGGVIQSTPYIGHPAYKAMGGRAAYTLATALFLGAAGLVGFFGYLYVAIPKAAIFPILIFVGLEIAAQSFLATPARHYPAVALACVPALASLVNIFVGKLLGAAGLSLEQLAQRSPVVAHEVLTARILANGFVVTSLLWASLLAMLIDGRLRAAALMALIAAGAALFGVIHSPLDGSPLVVPWDTAALAGVPAVQTPAALAAGYAAVAAMLLAWGLYRGERPAPRAPSTIEPG